MHSSDARQEMAELDLWMFGGVPEYADAMYSFDFFDLVEGRPSNTAAEGHGLHPMVARSRIGTTTWKYNAASGDWECTTEHDQQP